MDLDMRGRIGGSVDTSEAAAMATASRPVPDARGVLSYPTYQVAVAERGDTLASLASRVGLPAAELATYNGIQPGDTLRAGEVIALPRRVAAATPTTGAITPAGAIDITTLAGAAIDRASPTPAATGTSSSSTTTGGAEPIRHQVQRGETAFSIARLYGITPRALSDWNGLDSNYTLRAGQYLLIPTALPGSQQSAAASTTAPGAGSPTPVPPSASKPLPAATTLPAAAPAPAVPKPDIGTQNAPATASAAMSYPVQGSIIREYAKGKNDGIDIAAPVGSPVRAAANGTVAAITTNTENIPILVIKHPDNLLTVYTHIDGLTVQKGDPVSRGQTIGVVRAGDPARMHFEVRNGFDSVDPMKYLK
ncbi:LysM peptidoglycan-binding domain-containing protein [Puniceibacterium sediminis]|nr:LysM peptidoglycan-binding domain-containing protein [Puniceibacterium sediminis]